LIYDIKTKMVGNADNRSTAYSVIYELQ